jgi:thiol-disulfide isomerase/thioredoxin
MKKQFSLTLMLALCAAVATANCSNPNGNKTTTGSVATEQQAQQQNEQKEMAPDFTLTDIDGKSFTLSSLRGKIVVIDFWGSWCGWCIKGMPDMKKYYEKYKGKLEIVGVDCGDTDATWKAAVKKYELPWKHVYNPKGMGDITGLYEIQGFPTKIIVGKEGEVLKVVIGEDPEFYTALDEIMK